MHKIHLSQTQHIFSCFISQIISPPPPPPPFFFVNSPKEIADCHYESFVNILCPLLPKHNSIFDLPSSFSLIISFGSRARHIKNKKRKTKKQKRERRKRENIMFLQIGITCFLLTISRSSKETTKQKEKKCHQQFLAFVEVSIYHA